MGIKIFLLDPGSHPSDSPGMTIFNSIMKNRGCIKIKINRTVLKVARLVVAGIFLSNIMLQDIVFAQTCHNKTASVNNGQLGIWTFTDDPGRNRRILAEL